MLATCAGVIQRRRVDGASLSGHPYALEPAQQRPFYLARPLGALKLANRNGDRGRQRTDPWRACQRKPTDNATNAAPVNANVAPGDNWDFIALISASFWLQLPAAHT